MEIDASTDAFGVAARTVDPSATALDSVPSPLRWWREAIYVVLVYVAYSAVRNTFGSSGGGSMDARPAFDHARAIIDVERALHLYFEPDLQSWLLALPAHGLIRLWNIFYGLGHFVVTGGALVALYRLDKARYPTCRNTLLFTTLFALVGFAAYALMPPRLLDDAGVFGGCPVYAPGGPSACHAYGYVDTVDVYGGWASFGSDAMKSVSNQYAAMPSLHVGWSIWAAMVLASLTRRRSTRALATAYPLVTSFVIIVTANHYWIDGVGGALCLAAGSAVARALDHVSWRGALLGSRVM